MLQDKRCDAICNRKHREYGMDKLSSNKKDGVEPSFFKHKTF